MESYFSIYPGKLKKYRPSRNIDHINNIEGTELKRNKTSLCFNVGKYKKISRNKNILKDEKESNTISKKGIKNKLWNLNNKSCSCITPESFNPLINYRVEDKDKNKSKIKYYRNKDHFFHMNPTEIYQYKPSERPSFEEIMNSKWMKEIKEADENQLNELREKMITEIKKAGKMQTTSKKEKIYIKYIVGRKDIKSRRVNVNSINNLNSSKEKDNVLLKSVENSHIINSQINSFFNKKKDNYNTKINNNNNNKIKSITK